MWGMDFWKFLMYNPVCISYSSGSCQAPNRLVCEWKHWMAGTTKKKRKGGHPMSFENKSLSCADCGANFDFTAEEQEFFQSKGYTNEPKRCPTCRAARKSERGGGSNFGSSSNYGAPRQMFPATCASCGKTTEVPFEPRSGRPVYCIDCYRKVKPSR